MTETSRSVNDLLAAISLSFIPWATFLVALVVVGASYDETVSVGGIAAAAPLYLLFVALPSGLALAASGTGRLRLVVLTVMTGISVLAAVELVASDDAQAGLAVLLVPMAAIPLAVAVWVGRLVVERQPSRTDASDSGEGNLRPAVLAPTSDRVAALTVDAATVCGALYLPLTALSDAGLEAVAAIVGLAVAAFAFALPIWWRGGTLGHQLLGLAVVDASTMGAVGLGRSVARSLIVAGETVLITTLLPLLDLALVAATGRSLSDRLLRTSVIRTR
jgi:hypothetical protein